LIITTGDRIHRFPYKVGRKLEESYHLQIDPQSKMMIKQFVVAASLLLADKRQRGSGFWDAGSGDTSAAGKNEHLRTNDKQRSSTMT